MNQSSNLNLKRIGRAASLATCLASLTETAVPAQSVQKVVDLQAFLESLTETRLQMRPPLIAWFFRPGKPATIDAIGHA